jgi:hypothetical protein
MRKGVRMSDQPGRENIGDDLTTYSVDDEDQLQPEDTLDGSVDPLDRGYQVPDRLQGTTAWGTTPEEQRQDETIEQRIHQELPDPDTAYGAPDNESTMDQQTDMVGGDDPDAIPAEDDFVGSEGGRVGRLVAPDEGAHEDTESDAVATEEEAVSIDSPEESAMRYTDAEHDDPA